ncbi:MerC domain-containing protein [Arcticibacter sp.]|uniref:MerC domain-containing protein n=1 Tax=Arcticibacter sp. TaxID=1872630 RepID=UPI0038910FB0
METEPLTSKLDKIGITASTFCAIHCAVVPFIISVLPLWGLGFLAEEWMEILMIVLSLTIGSWSLGLSWIKHRRTTALLIFICGFLFIAAGHWFGHGSSEHLFLPAGGLTIALAHYVNWKQSLVLLKSSKMKTASEIIK